MSDRDRRLAEAMGMCWHYLEYNSGWAPFMTCKKCGKVFAGHCAKWIEYPPDCPDFSLPEWRARLMDWAVGEEWWEGFYRKTWREWYRKQDAWSVSREAKYVVHLWRNLPDLVSEYWEGRK